MVAIIFSSTVGDGEETFAFLDISSGQESGPNNRANRMAMANVSGLFVKIIIRASGRYRMINLYKNHVYKLEML